MSRSRLAIVCTLVLVAVAITVGIAATRSSGHGATASRPTNQTGTSKPTAAPASPAKAAAAPFTSTNASALSLDLASGQDTKIKDALGIPAAQPLDPAAATALRSLGPITFDTSTFTATESDVGTVTGTVAHPPVGQPARWTFHLKLLGRQWRVVTAEPAA